MTPHHRKSRSSTSWPAWSYLASSPMAIAESPTMRSNRRIAKAVARTPLPRPLWSAGRQVVGEEVSAPVQQRTEVDPREAVDRAVNRDQLDLCPSLSVRGDELLALGERHPLVGRAVDQQKRRGVSRGKGDGAGPGCQLGHRLDRRAEEPCFGREC